jgi:hypothetical protein
MKKYGERKTFISFTAEVAGYYQICTYNKANHVLVVVVDLKSGV